MIEAGRTKWPIHVTREGEKRNPCSVLVWIWKETLFAVPKSRNNNIKTYHKKRQDRRVRTGIMGLKTRASGGLL
jgi:hypothetical protein